jgi:hypothetical protein
MLVPQGLGGVLRYGVLPAPDLTFVAKYPMSGNWPHNGYSKEVGAYVASAGSDVMSAMGATQKSRV